MQRVFGYIVKRDRKKLIRFRRYDPRRADEKYDWHREQLLLFMHFRSEADEVELPEAALYERFEQCQEEIAANRAMFEFVCNNKDEEEHMRELIAELEKRRDAELISAAIESVIILYFQ